MTAKTCPILAAAAIAGAMVKGGQVPISADLVACKGERCQWWVPVSWCELQPDGWLGPPQVGGWCRIAGERKPNEENRSSG